MITTCLLFNVKMRVNNDGKMCGMLISSILWSYYEIDYTASMNILVYPIYQKNQIF